MARKFLLVIKSPPYGSGRAAEGLRMATAMVAMDVLPQILFMDDGVYCLLKDQRPEAAGLKSFAERLKTLADLVGLHVSSDSLTQRKLIQLDLDEDYKVEALSLQKTAKLFSQNEVVIAF